MENLRLSVEEMAYAMGLMGGGEQARTFLRTVIGERGEAEMNGRLLAAAHSLMARGLLTLGGDQGRELNRDVRKMLEHVLGATYSVRVSKIVRNDEHIVGYFFKDREVVEHRVDQAVVCCMQRIGDSEQFVERVRVLLEIPNVVPESEAIGLATVSADSLNDARLEVQGGNRGKAVEILLRNGITTDLANDLVRDMSRMEWRGSVLRVTSRANELTSDEGFLVLKGQGTPWLFEIVAVGSGQANILRGNESNLRSLLLKMTR